MKSIFTKLSTLVLCGAFAMVGCSDFSADLKDLNGKLEDLAATTATKTEVAALKASIEELQAKLAEQYATKAEVSALNETVTALQGALNTAKADLQAAIDKKASKEELTAAVTNVQAAITELTNGLEALSTKNATLESAVETLKGDLATAQAALEAALAEKADMATVDAALGRITNLETDLATLEESLEDYAGEVNQKFADVEADIEALTESVNEQLEQIKKDADAADAAVVEQIQASLATINAELAKKADDADVAAVEASVKALETAVASIKTDATALSNAINTALAAATTEYKALAADLQSQIDELKSSLGDLVADVEGMKTELRSIVSVPQTMYNGTKAVKFHRIEGENVLKTYADVSFHFNPANFDVTKATYAIVAEPVEFMTKAIFAEEPAIEIVGAPVQENGKVTFRLERAEGAGNMFALKATLEDGCVIYSDYTAILDEATFAVATATASFPVERIAFELPKLNSISAIVDFVQSLGTVVEDFETSINAVKGAVEAIQNNDLENVLANLVDIPGIKKVQTNITATGTYKVQVETLDAEEIIELLQNAQSIDEIRAIITDLLGKANGLGEVGSTIVDGLNGAFGNSGLNDLLGQYDNLENLELPSLILSYEQAEAKLNQYTEQLAQAKAEYESLKAEMDAIVAGLSDEDQAAIATLQAELDALNAQYEDLQAQLDAASGLDKITIGAEAAVVWGKIEAKELEITTKAGTDYFLVKAEYDLKAAGVATAELLLQGAKEGLKVADEAVKKAEEHLANLETEILAKIKDYIFNNTELGQYIKELENALAEQGWEAKKAAAKGVAELGALDAVIAGLIQNYNAANEAVIADFANSLFGRFTYLIETEEAAQAFEAIGLTEVYVALKQIPSVIEFVIKYYPSGADFSSFEDWNDITSILSNYITELIPEMNTEWEIDYLLAE